jgi:iron(III) transport system permease protein
MLPRGHVTGSEQPATPFQTFLLWALLGGWTLVALLPHFAVVGQSFSAHWFFSVLPDTWTTEHYSSLWGHGLTASSIRNSLHYFKPQRLGRPGPGSFNRLAAHPPARPVRRTARCSFDVASGTPGLVLAFGYVAAFDFETSWLNPRLDPVFLLVISYSVRRLPYIVRSAYAGFQQTSVTLEEASANLGASPWRTLRKITLPLVTGHLIAGTLLTFSFAMLEVSDGLILAMKDVYFPLTKMIYVLMGRIDPGAPGIACALGVIGMLLLTTSLLLAGRLLGKKLGQLFRA